MSHISLDELEQIYSFAIDLGKKAGSMLLQGVDIRTKDKSSSNTDKEELQLVEKDSQVDIVTQTDEGEEISSPE